MTSLYIVEDNLHVAQVLTDVLSKSGFHCHVFNSADALLKAYPTEFSVLLLDIRLPGISGITLYRQLLKESRAWTAIFLSGHINDNIKTELNELPGCDYLIKPFRNDALVEKVKATIAASKHKH